MNALSAGQFEIDMGFGVQALLPAPPRILALD